MAWNDRPYCVRHYRGQPRNPSTRHDWVRSAQGTDADGRYESFHCRYCGLRFVSRDNATQERA